MVVTLTNLINLFGRETAVRMMNQMPLVIAFTWETLESKIRFVVEDMGRGLGDVAMWPALLTRSVEKRLRPRYKLLLEAGKAEKYGLGYMFGCKDVDFEKRFGLKLPKNREEEEEEGSKEGGEEKPDGGEGKEEEEEEVGEEGEEGEEEEVLVVKAVGEEGEGLLVVKAIVEEGEEEVVVVVKGIGAGGEEEDERGNDGKEGRERGDGEDEEKKQGEGGRQEEQEEGRRVTRTVDLESAVKQTSAEKEGGR
ncbi:unnamed protein product [Closterium sp. Yama58-4]|nr:unnamed protein product [Closterium sp. Yama58-4]